MRTSSHYRKTLREPDTRDSSPVALADTVDLSDTDHCVGVASAAGPSCGVAGHTNTFLRAERPSGGRLVLPAETWTEARLKPAGDAIALSDGRSGYALEAAPGIVYSIDNGRLSLDITAAATAFEATALSLSGRFPLPSGPRQPGVYLTYDATYTGAEGSGPSYGALVEGVAFGSLGGLVSDVVISNSEFQKDVIRADTYWRLDRSY